MRRMHLHEEPYPFNAMWGSVELATDGAHRYLIVPMGLNQRLIGIDSYEMPVYGWCFKSGHHAMAALVAWDPYTQDEPILWHKRAGELRQAPCRDLNLDYNRPRCVHGSYLHERVCDINPLCREMPRQGSR